MPDSWRDAPLVDDERKTSWRDAPLVDEDQQTLLGLGKLTPRQAEVRATVAGLGKAAGMGFTQDLLAIPNWAYKKLEAGSEKLLGPEPFGGRLIKGKLEESPYYQELQNYEPETISERYAHRIGQYAGGAVGPGLAVAKGAKLINALRPGGVFGFRSLAAMPGSTFAGYEAGGALLGGTAAQTAEEAGAGPVGQAVAGLAGGLAAPFTTYPAGRAVVQGLDAYRAARQAALPDLLAEPAGWLGSELGMAGSVPRRPPPPPTPGPGAPGYRGTVSAEVRQEALQGLADQITARNITQADLERFLDTGDWAHVFHSGGKMGPIPTTQAEALMDIPELAKYAGSLRRLYPSAAAESDPFLTARRTGIEPPGGLPPTAGLKTYPEGAKELLEVPRSGVQSAGVQMRAGEGMRRLLRVHDARSHGHGATAEETVNIIDKELRAAAQPHWDQFDAAAKLTPMQNEPTLNGFLSKWEAEAAREGVAGTSKGRAINKALNEVSSRDPTTGQRRIFNNANDVHFGKQTIDDQVENYLKAVPGSTQRQVGGLINELKKDLVTAIEGVKTNDLGVHYNRGRLIHAGGQQTKREVEMGQQLWKSDDPTKNADIFERYDAMSRAEKKRVRLGFASGYMHEIAGKPISSDVSKLTTTVERQRVLERLVESSKGRGAFADRPQRGRAFMRSLGQEKATETTVMGGPQTAERIAADELNNTLHGIGDVIKTAASGSIRSALMQAGELALKRMFGMRAEVAAEQMRILASANPAENRRAVAELSMYLGRTRAMRFAEYMQRLAAQSGVSVMPPAMGAAAE